MALSLGQEEMNSITSLRTIHLSAHRPGLLGSLQAGGPGTGSSHTLKAAFSSRSLDPGLGKGEFRHF